MPRVSAPLLFGLCAASLPLAALAHAQEIEKTAENAGNASNYGAHASVRAPIASTSKEDATASGTTLDVTQRSVALETAAEVIAEAPGARVRSTGGFGSFSGVALRGAGIEHTSVLLGDLPLNTADTGAFDLSLVPLSVLDSIEVYRGGAPIWWSDGAIGGVVRLVPASVQHNFLGAQTGFGSFGHFELGATSAIARTTGARPALFAHVGFARADNDYSYVDDNQTRFDTPAMKASADDVTRHQQNAGIALGDALMHAGLDLAGGRLDLVMLGHEQNEGIPGPLSAPTLDTHRHLLRALGAVGWTLESRAPNGERRYRLQVLASANHQNDQLSDAGGRVGVLRPVAANDDWNRAFARVAGSFALTSFLEPTLIASVARDDYLPEDPLAFPTLPQPSHRTSEALAFEARLHGQVGDTQLELRPSLRGQWSKTSAFIQSYQLGQSSRDEHQDALATYRIAAVVAPWPAVSFSASASTGARLPSMLELFGDRALQESNPTLKPERSRSFDASVVVRGHAGELRGSAELRGFALFIDDLISYRRTSQYTVRPENVDSARILGGELGTQLAYGRHLALAGSLTTMQTENQFHKALPLRPPLQLSVRPELSLYPSFADRAVLFVEAEHISFVYLDPANLTFLDGRTLLSAGAALRFLQERITLGARAQNLLDQAATDVLSRPLPGFNFLVSLAVTEAVP